MRIQRAFCLGLGAFIFVSDLAAANWRQFRGPTAQGLSTETGLPLRWNATEGIAWKTPLPGEAWSLPSAHVVPVLWTNASGRTHVISGAGHSICRLCDRSRRDDGILVPTRLPGLPGRTEAHG